MTPEVAQILAEGFLAEGFKVGMEALKAGLIMIGVGMILHGIFGGSK